MLHSPLQRSELSLADTPNSAHWARLHLADVFTRWGVKLETIDAAKLAISELATNAATHGSGPKGAAPSNPGLAKVGILTIGLELHPGLVRILVWDRNPTPPSVKLAGEEDESGRGLFLVEHVSLRWGHYPKRSSTGVQGKVVWADFALLPDTGNTGRVRTAQVHPDPGRGAPRANPFVQVGIG